MTLQFGLGVSSLDHRRREEFPAITIDERRKLIYKMLNFTVSCSIARETIIVFLAQN